MVPDQVIDLKTSVPKRMTSWTAIVQLGRDLARNVWLSSPRFLQVIKAPSHSFLEKYVLWKTYRLGAGSVFLWTPLSERVFNYYDMLNISGVLQGRGVCSGLVWFWFSETGNERAAGQWNGPSWPKQVTWFWLGSLVESIQLSSKSGGCSLRHPNNWSPASLHLEVSHQSPH